MLSIRYLDDPLKDSLLSGNHKGQNVVPVHSCLAHVQVSIQALFSAADDASSQLAALDEDANATRIALSDYVARCILNLQAQQQQQQAESSSVFASVQLLDQCTAKTRRSNSNSKTSRTKVVPYPPYILQRSDVWCSESHLHAVVRVVVQRDSTNITSNGSDAMDVEVNGDCQNFYNSHVEHATNSFFKTLFGAASLFVDGALRHVACAVLQQRARLQLSNNMDAVAFIADGAILPRKSGASSAPMKSPPAVPFAAPPNSSMSNKELVVEMGALYPYTSRQPGATADANQEQETASSTKVKLTGLCIPTGITLICGGGYHGKSTMLRTISAGVYDKIPGDGREFCVTVYNAVSVRAEDGRYINNCNISAFISNLPKLPGIDSTATTTHFGTKEASGSTSQAANVSEAIEMGATALLVDEDVSAANFMARDGRMRALVMDESITPLLYRVNGLFQFHGVSSVVVVGGVGDWLDVQDHVVLLDKYVASDATEKARSISYQFSYGHVQYAGRGVVHRLPWDKGGSPLRRRPADSFIRQFTNDSVISILDGGSSLSLLGETDSELQQDDDEHLGLIDMSRCEQLSGNKSQLFGCGVCVKWLLSKAQQDPSLSLCELLDKMEETLSQPDGMLQMFASSTESFDSTDPSWQNMAESVGCILRPRKHEVAMALLRMRGGSFEELPVHDDGAEAEAAREEERKKRELMEMWNSRRKSRPAYG